MRGGSRSYFPAGAKQYAVVLNFFRRRLNSARNPLMIHFSFGRQTAEQSAGCVEPDLRRRRWPVLILAASIDRNEFRSITPETPADAGCMAEANVKRKRQSGSSINIQSPIEG